MTNKVLTFPCESELPLERLVDGYSNTTIFRRIAFIGDSLSSGEFESRDSNGAPGYHDLYEYSWGQYIARKNGLLAYNFSCGGMTAKWYVDSYANEKGFWDKDKACQAYVIALGVNDLLNQNHPLGSLSDLHPTDCRQNASTFAGYYGQIVSRLKEIQPDAKFFFVTMPRETPEEEPVRAAHAALLQQFTEHFENAYLIDLYRYAPVYDAAFRRHYFLYGHMNAAGYLLTAKFIDSYIDYIVRHNPDDFRRVPYIGTALK